MPIHDFGFSLLNADCQEGIAELKRVAECLKSATAINEPRRSFGGGIPRDLTDKVGFSEDPMQLVLGSSVAVTQNSLREVGCFISRSLTELEAKLEAHIMDYFVHMKKKAAEDHYYMPRLSAPSTQDVPQHRASETVRSGAEAASSPQKKKDLQEGSALLQSWLFVQLESLMEVTKASKGAVYLKNSDGYLKQAIELPGSGSGLPKDVGLASGSTLGTVYSAKIGIRIDREETASSASSSTVLPIRNGVAMPLLNGCDQPVGCVIVAEKGGSSSFDEFDESMCWAFSNSAKGVFSRYPLQCFFPTARAEPNPLKKIAQLPPVVEPRPLLQLRMPRTNPEDDGAPPLHHNKMLVVRPGGECNTVLTKELQALPKSEISPEKVLESVAPYLRHIETLWRRSLDNVTELKAECSRWDETVNRKNNHIIELEIQLKALQKQMAKVKADVGKVKSVIPLHLAEVKEKDPALVSEHSPNAAKSAQTRRSVAPQPAPPQVPQTSRRSHDRSSVGK